jgi:hypothetical protein
MKKLHKAIEESLKKFSVVTNMDLGYQSIYKLA